MQVFSTWFLAGGLAFASSSYRNTLVSGSSNWPPGDSRRFPFSDHWTCDMSDLVLPAAYYILFFRLVMACRGLDRRLVFTRCTDLSVNHLGFGSTWMVIETHVIRSIEDFRKLRANVTVSWTLWRGGKNLITHGSFIDRWPFEFESFLHAFWRRQSNWRDRWNKWPTLRRIIYHQISLIVEN